MNVLPTTLPGVLVVEPRVFRDARGWVMESFHRDRYRAAGIATDLEFVQDNVSFSVRNTVRGLHYQRGRQGKLVSVTRGAVFDVAVDVRAGSPTLGAWFGVELSEETARQVWIPPGFAHGFLAITDVAIVQYKLTMPYTPSEERSVAWNDPQLAIAWPLAGEPVVSDKDREAPPLRSAELYQAPEGS